MIALSWIGNVLIVLGLWYVGKKKWWAFAFSIAGESAWIAYSLTAHLWSLAFICVIFNALALRNLLLWKREARQTGEDVRDRAASVVSRAKNISTLYTSPEAVRIAEYILHG